jgi:hypothetical protein
LSKVLHFLIFLSQFIVYIKDKISMHLIFLFAVKSDDFVCSDIPPKLIPILNKLSLLYGQRYRSTEMVNV